MRFDTFALLILTYASGLAALRLSPDKRLSNRPPPQRLEEASEEEGDHVAAETTFGGPVAAATGNQGSKYFQYIHEPAKDHYEHGHRRGNEHHFIERHEKGHPHAGEFKTKVRWGDKHGGYGEHYYDYNHGGDGEESQHHADYAEYEETRDAPIHTRLDGALRGKRQPTVPEDVEFINPKARTVILSGKAQKHGGNYRRYNDFRGKRDNSKKGFGQSLVFDPVRQVIIDEDTGKKFKLELVE